MSLLLRLSAAPASTQIVQRDRHAEYFTALALVGSVLGEVRDRGPAPAAGPKLREGRRGVRQGPERQLGHAAQAQPPSSARTSRVLARLLRGYSVSAMEGRWRCGTSGTSAHSSVERVIGPDATVNPWTSCFIDLPASWMDCASSPRGG